MENVFNRCTLGLLIVLRFLWLCEQGPGKISRSTTDHLEPVRWLQVCVVHYYFVFSSPGIFQGVFGLLISVGAIPGVGLGIRIFNVNHPNLLCVASLITIQQVDLDFF